MLVRTKIITQNLAAVLFSSLITAFAFHYFILYNGFVPGGVSGLAAITAYLLKSNAGYFSFLFNLPILLLVFLKVKKFTAGYVFAYITMQSLFLILFEKFGAPVYTSGGNQIIAAIGGGVLSGTGFAVMLKFFGVSGGTYAIGALMQKRNPSLNIVWLSFVMDSLVVALSFPVYNMAVEAAICTFINLYIANRVSDAILQGFKISYKYEIVTDKPEIISDTIIREMNGTVTKIEAVGMYTHISRSLLVCIVRKRQMGEMYRILKGFPDSYVFVTKINDQIGHRK